MQLLHDSAMAEGGPDHEHVDQLLTPVSAMHISPSASRRFRVNKATVSPTGGGAGVEESECADSV